MTTPGKPQSSTQLTENNEADLTSLDWNSTGTLLAVGAYDAKLRVLTAAGDIYFEADNYKVGKGFRLPYRPPPNS